MAAVFLAVISAYDVEVGAAATLYYSNRGFVSSPSDTPADTYFEPRLVQPLGISRALFTGGSTLGQVTVGKGSLILSNADGGLDALGRYSFDGRAVTVYRGDDSAAFPSGFTVLWSGTMLNAELSRKRLTIQLRDNQLDLDRPVQTTKYAGDNALPLGLEGVEDVEGKPKPLAFGRVRNVPAVMVNSSKLIYQVSSRAISSVPEVYDAGRRLSKSVDNWESQDSGSEVRMAFAYKPSTARWVAVGLDGTGLIQTSDDDGDTWTTRSNPFVTASEWVRGVVWAEELGLFVAVGGVAAASGRIATSPDGVTWTARTETFTDRINGIAWNGTTLVAVGNGCEIETSTDGVTWTSRTPGGAEPIWGIAWGAGLFVSGRETGEVWTSPDGVTWTQRGNPMEESADGVYGVTYAIGRFVAVGADGLSMFSFDGINWSPGFTVPCVILEGVTYFEAGGVFLAAGTGYATLGSVGIVLASIDGIVWRAVEVGQTGIGCIGVAANDTTALLGCYQGRWSRVIAPLTDYASESELLDDDETPPPGSFRVYPAGGMVRLGSPPSGQITADVDADALDATLTAGQIFRQVLEHMGKSILANIQSVDDLTAWTATSSPTLVSSVDDPVGGRGAYTVRDSGASVSYVNRNQAFTGDGVKLVELVVRSRNLIGTGAAHRFVIRQTSGSAADRLSVHVEAQTDADMTVNVTVGTIVLKEYGGNGYWRIIVATTSVTAAETHNWQVVPSGIDAAHFGAVDVYRFRGYNASSYTEDWSWMDVLRADAMNATVCGLWTGLQDAKASELLTQLAASVGGWWGVDREGVYRFQVLEDPDEAANMLADPFDLSSAAWTLAQATLTENAARTPNGRMDGWKLVETTANNVHSISQPVRGYCYDGRIVTTVFYAKAAGRDRVAFRPLNRQAAADTATIVDLTDGSVVQTGAYVESVEVTEVGDEWYRIAVEWDTGVEGATPASSEALVIMPVSTGTTVSYAGDITKGVYLWKPQQRDPAVVTLVADDMVRPLERQQGALPTYRHIVRYQRNHTPQKVGLAHGVSDARRGVLGEPFQTVELDESGSPHNLTTNWPLAREQTVDTVMDTRAGALTEVARVQALRGQQRDRYSVRLALDDTTQLLDLGQQLLVQHERFLLEIPRAFTILHVEPDAAAKVLDLEVWG